MESFVVRSIIRNERYVGDAVMRKFIIESPLTHRRVTNKGQRDKFIVKDGHQGIIDRETWDKAQVIADANAKKYKIIARNSQLLITPYTGFGYCPYCKKQYIVKLNRKVRMLYDSSNKSRLTCFKSESVFVEHLDKIIPLQIKVLKDNEVEFKKALSEAFSIDDNCETKQKITTIENELIKLREKTKKYTNYTDAAFDEVRDELKAQIDKKVKEKTMLENDLLIALNPESRIKQVICALRDFPNDESIKDYDFRSLLKRMVVFERNKIVFIIGNDDMTKLLKKMIPSFTSSFKYKSRRTSYTCVFGIYINR